MTTLTQNEAATSKQVRHVGRLGSDAIEKVLEELGVDKQGVQRVHERGDEFVAAIRQAAILSIKDLSVTDKFKNEEVQSNYHYPSGYRLKGITEQTNILRQIFSGIGFADEKLAEAPLPADAEGYFAIPKWQSMATTYSEALQKVLDSIKSRRTFYSYGEGKLAAQYLRQMAKTEKAFERLAKDQDGYDILVVPAQFGLTHRGRSVRRAREVMNASEFGLGAFAVGIMLLTHPERMVQWEQLHIDCAGDEYATGAGGDFSSAPIFDFSGDGVGFYTVWAGTASEYYGSASGFFPQQ